MTASIEDLLEDYKQGKMIILIDDESRENEGDLLIAAEKVTKEGINFYGYSWPWINLFNVDTRTLSAVKSSFNGFSK